MNGGSGFDFYGAGSCRSADEVSTLNPVVGGGVDLSLRAGTARYPNSGETDHLTEIEGAYGTWDEDTLVGDDRANHFYAGGSNDEIDGGGGDDYLNGGRGADRIDGGEGYDICVDGEILFNCEESLLAILVPRRSLV